MKNLLILSALALSTLSVQAFAEDAAAPAVAAAPPAVVAPAPDAAPTPAMIHHDGSMGREMHDKMTKRMEEADTNKDGTISHEEFIAQAEKHFKEMDADNDGKITKEERQKFHESHKEKRKERRAKMKDRIKDKMKDKAAEKTSEAPKQ